MVESIVLETFKGVVGAARSVVMELLKESRARSREEQELESLTRALAIEIAELVIAVGRRHAWWSEHVDPKVGWLPPLIVFSRDAYDQLRAKIDRLAPEVVAAIVRFHGYLHFVNAMHATREEYVKAGRAGEFYDTYKLSLETLLGDIAPATIDTLKRHLGA